MALEGDESRRRQAVPDLRHERREEPLRHGCQRQGLPPEIPLRSRYTACKENTVYINVWNWDSGWEISVKENGKPLTVTQVRAEDPLHNLSYDIPRTASNGSITSSFATYNTTHIFSVEAASATSTLEIEIRDRFGVPYTESMTRPKAFTTHME